MLKIEVPVCIKHSVQCVIISKTSIMSTTLYYIKLLY